MHLGERARGEIDAQDAGRRKLATASGRRGSRGPARWEVGARVDALVNTAELVTPLELGFLCVAALLAGVVDAIAGGGGLLTLPSLSLLVAVSQINRDGDVRGGEELAHECDVLVEVTDLTWTVRKSRYQPAGAHGPVLAPAPRAEPEAIHVSA